MEFREVRDSNQTPIIKWSAVPPGTVIEGIKGETVQGKFSPLTTITTTTGIVLVPITAALVARMEAVPEGAHVKLEYLGLKDSLRGGRSYHAHTVSVADGDTPKAGGRGRKFA